MLLQVLTGDLTFKSLRPCNLETCTKSEIKAYFENSYSLNESIFTGLKDESVFTQYPDQLRLPLMFYYGHTACVYMNKLVLTGLLKPSQRVNFEFESLFETGVDEMSWDDTENFRMGGEFKWPSLKDVVEYRRKVKEVILQIIDETPLSLPVTMESPWWGILMGMEHERIHLETSSVLIRQLPIDMVQVPEGWKYAPSSIGQPVNENPMITMEEEDVCLGKPVDFPTYGWDNEYGKWQTKVPAFKASKYLVTNREFLEFVQDNGYGNLIYWTKEGWEWKSFRQAKHPTFWVCTEGCRSGCGSNLKSYSHCKPLKHVTNGHNSYCNGHSNVDENGHQGKDEGGGHSQYRLRCMYSEIDLPLDWPAEVNYHEAKAFCAWKGPQYRLLAEAETHVIRGDKPHSVGGEKNDIIWEKKIESNLNLQFGSSSPVNFYPPNEKGFCDTYGNVWEWVEDHFNGLPGYTTHHLYDDFSSPTFDGKHNIILGGSWISTGDEASRFARYAFRRHFFQHLGFRLAYSIKDEDADIKIPIRLVSTGVYVCRMGVQGNTVHLPEGLRPVYVESTNSQYEHEHSEDQDDKFIESYTTTKTLDLTEHCKDLLDKYNIDRTSALHVGCGNGKFTAELGNLFNEVIGQDYCGYCIDSCQKSFAGISLSDLDQSPPKKAKSNIIFKQLTWLPNEIEFHDFIVASFLDRVMNARAWLIRFKEVLKEDGLLMIISFDKWDCKALEKEFGSSYDLVSNKEIKGMGRKSNISMYVTGWQHRGNKI